MTDILTPLIDAYRAENPSTSLDSRALRTRILLASARRHQNPLRRLRWLLLPVAAAFIASASLAATPTTRPALLRFLTHLTHAFRPPTSPASPFPRTRPTAPAPLTLSPHPDLPRDPLASVPPLPPPAPASAHPHPTSAPASRSVSASTSDPRSASAPAPAPAPASPSSDLSPDLSAYRVAHRLHFESADYTRALTAWNGYLTRFPTGTFAPEARLNRAVCLARLGRIKEARAALEAIAQGTYGRYGREQAQRLLDALSDGR